MPPLLMPDAKETPFRGHGYRFKVGYYRPTYAFQCIEEFMAILDQQEGMVGLTGASSSREAALNARLFALSPCLLTQLKSLYQVIRDNGVVTGFCEQEQDKASIQVSGVWIKTWLLETAKLLIELENYPVQPL